MGEIVAQLLVGDVSGRNLDRYPVLGSYRFNRKQKKFNISGGLQQLNLNDVADGGIGFVDGGLDFAFRLMPGVRSMVKEAVGERPTEALVKEDEEQGDFDALV